MKSIQVLLVLGVLGSWGCSVKSEEFKYSYLVNGCETGEHSFDEKDKYCEALSNHELNHKCAYFERKDAFARDCGGKAWAVDQFQENTRRG